MRCKSLPEEWTAGGRLSDVSVQERTIASGRNREETVCLCVKVCACVPMCKRERGKGRAVEKGLGH